VGQYLHLHRRKNSAEPQIVIKFSFVLGFPLEAKLKLILISFDETDDAIVEKCVGVRRICVVKVVEFRVWHTKFAHQVTQLACQLVDVLHRSHPVVVRVMQENRRSDGLQVIIGRRKRSVFQQIFCEAEIEHSELCRVHSLCVVHKLIHRGACE
jgi:hypothetical protein